VRFWLWSSSVWRGSRQYWKRFRDERQEGRKMIWSEIDQAWLYPWEVDLLDSIFISGRC
jgi:hypothetical protein